MTDKLKLNCNCYFIFPFVIWVVVGFLAVFFIEKNTLFLVINNNNNEFLDLFFYYVTKLGQAEIIVPVLLFFVIFKRYRNWQFLLLAALCNLVPFILQQILKSYLYMPRPFTQIDDISRIHILPSWPRLFARSMPSGHTVGAFSFFFFLTLILPNRFRFLGFLFFTLAFFVAYSRIYLAAHFFLDVYVGSIIGVSVTWIVFFTLQNILSLDYDTKPNKLLV